MTLKVSHQDFGNCDEDLDQKYCLYNGSLPHPSRLCPLYKALLGSVAKTVFRQCPCPVLTVGPKATTHLDLPAETKEILYATDFTPEAKAAAPTSSHLLRTLGSPYLGACDRAA